MTTILISGASVAGPALAYWLRRDPVRRDAGVEYLFDDSIASLEQDEDGVQVVLERGGSRRFDLVIGTDGLHSNVRALAFGPEEKFSHQLGYYASVYTVANHLGLDHTGRFLSVPGKTVGTYSARDNTEAKAMFYFASPEPALDRQDVAAQQKVVAETYAGLGWEVPRLLAGMQDAPDFYFDSISQIKLDSYSTGRVAWLATRATAPHRCQAWVPVSRSSAPMSWPANSTRPTATTRRPTPSTTR